MDQITNNKYSVEDGVTPVRVESGKPHLILKSNNLKVKCTINAEIIWQNYWSINYKKGQMLCKICQSQR